jgi:hypothetical protein
MYCIRLCIDAVSEKPLKEECREIIVDPKINPDPTIACGWVPDEEPL